MKHENLKEVLNENGYIDVEIKNLYILKLGCTTYSNFSDEDDSIYEKNEDDYLQKIDPSKILDETAEALKKHHHVFDLNLELREHSWTTGTIEHTFIDAGLIKLRIEQPERFQKYKSYSINKPIEKFDVTTKGSSFIAYAPVSNINQLTHIAHEYREIIKKQVDEETEFFSNVLGPNPIHPDIYLVFVEEPENGDKSDEKQINDQKNSKTERGSVNMIPYKDDLLLIVDSKVKLDDIIVETLEIINSDLIEFYRLMSIRSKLISYNAALHSLFKSLSNSVVEKLETQWYRVFKLHNLIRQARKDISMAHIMLVEFDNILISHRKQKENYKTEIRDHVILSHFSNYLLHHSHHDSELPESFKSSINHFEKEIHLFNNLKIVILASITGAIIGSLLTFLLTVFSPISETISHNAEDVNNEKIEIIEPDSQ